MNAMPPPAGSPGTSFLARAALALYPAAWRARYGDEVRALLDDSGAGPRAIASLAWRALPAWIWPPRHLYGRPARMRASLATVLVAWTALTGLALVFAQLTQAQGLRPASHPVVQWSYWVFDGAFLVSVLAVAAGGLPLWLLMMRSARREHRPRDLAYLLSPVVAPAMYLAALSVTVRLIHPVHGVGRRGGCWPSSPVDSRPAGFRPQDPGWPCAGSARAGRPSGWPPVRRPSPRRP